MKILTNYSTESIKQFERLNRTDQIIVTVVALYYNGVSRWTLFSLLSEIADVSKDIISYDSLEIQLEDLSKKKLIVLGYHLRCPTQLSNIIVRNIKMKPYYSAIEADVFAKVIRLDFWNGVVHLEREEALRLLRFALYHRSSEEYLNLFRSLRKLDQDEALTQMDKILEPFDRKWVETLSIGIQTIIAKHLFYPLLLTSEEDPVVTWMLKFVEKSEDEEFISLLAFRKFCQGEVAEAKQLVEKGESVFTQNMKLAFAYMERKDVDEAFEQSLEVFKKQSRKRKDFFRDIGAFFYGVHLLTQEIPDRNKLFGYSLRYDPPVQIETIFYYLVTAVEHQKSGKFSYDDKKWLLKHISADVEPLRSFFAMLIVVWFEPKLLKLEKVLSLQAVYKENNLSWFLAETALILERMDQENLSDSSALKYFETQNIRPLTNLITAKEEWEHTVDSIFEAFQIVDENKAEMEKSTRLIWLLQVYDSRISLTAKEQTRSEYGKWSKGRKVDLEQLYRESGKMESLSAQDKQIVATIKTPGSYTHGAFHNRHNYHFAMARTVQFLVEHPLIFSNDRMQHPIALHKREPKLEIKKGTNGYTVQISPSLKKEPYVLEEEAPYVYNVTIFSEEQLKLARKLGDKLKIPKKGKEQVEKIMQHLTPVIAVQSNVQDLELEIETVKGSTQLLLQLFPFGEGLKIELRVRPFGEKGTFVRPGEGETILLSYLDGKAIQAERNLGKEKQHRQQLLDNCPSLLFLDEGNTGVVGDLQTCLEIVTEVQEISDPNIQVEWPKGKSLTLKKADMVDFSLSIEKKNQWFEASGELLIDENLALDINQLFDLIAESNNQFIQLGNGEFLSLTTELRKRLNELAALTNQGSNNSRMFHPLSALAIQSVVNDFTEVNVDQHWQDLQQKWTALEGKEYKIPSTLRGELRNYQEEGFRWLSRLADLGLGTCLADDMGLGKTVQVLAFLLSQAAKGPILVVSPSSVCLNWESEVIKFAPTLRTHRLKSTERKKTIDSLGGFDILVCSYGLMQSESKNLQKIDWQCIVLDEAHSIKNSKTKRSKAIMKFNAEIRIALTGTPIQNHLGEIWNLFAFLNPGMLGTEGQFNQKFNQNDSHSKKHLNQQLRPFLLRRTKNEVLQELPSKTEIVQLIEPSIKEQALYEALRIHAIQAIQDSEKPAITQVLKQLTRLRLACCHPQLVQAGLGMSSSKLEYFLRLVVDLIENGHKVLVFSQFVKHLSLIQKQLKEKEISYQYFDGSTPQKTRKKRIDAFQAGEGDLFLISLKSGGVGINLTAADYVIHMDPWWNPAVEDQASDRAHRIGQQRPVTVYRLIMKNSIEEKIIQLHEQKRGIADELLTGTGSSGKLTMHELMEMLNENYS